MLVARVRLPGAGRRGPGQPECVVLAAGTIVLIVIVLLAAVVAGWLAYRAVAHRQAQRERARARLSTEVRGHRQELEASAIRARESSDAAEARFARAGEHRGEADRFECQVVEHERFAAEEESAAQ